MAKASPKSMTRANNAAINAISTFDPMNRTAELVRTSKRCDLNVAKLTEMYQTKEFRENFEMKALMSSTTSWGPVTIPDNKIGELKSIFTVLTCSQQFVKNLFAFEAIMASASANNQNSKNCGHLASMAGIQNNSANLNNLNKGYGVNTATNLNKECDVGKATEETVISLQMLANSITFLTEQHQQGQNRNSAPVLECLDVLLKYVTYVLHKCNVSRILNQLTELLDSLMTHLEKSSYALNDVEVAILFPVLLDKLGNSKDHLRDFLNGFLRRVLNLYLDLTGDATHMTAYALPGLRLTRVATLMLVRGLSNTNNQKSKLDVLVHLEEVVLRAAVSHDVVETEDAANAIATGAGSSSSSSSMLSGGSTPRSSSVLKSRKAKRIALIIARSKRDTSLIAMQLEATVPEIKKQALKVFEALYLALDTSSFSGLIRNNNTFHSPVAAQEIDRVLKNADASMVQHYRSVGPTTGANKNEGFLERYVRDAYSHLFSQDELLADLLREENQINNQLANVEDVMQVGHGLDRIDEVENENGGTPADLHKQAGGYGERLGLDQNSSKSVSKKSSKSPGAALKGSGVAKLPSPKRGPPSFGGNASQKFLLQQQQQFQLQAGGTSSSPQDVRVSAPSFNGLQASVQVQRKGSKESAESGKQLANNNYLRFSIINY